MDKPYLLLKHDTVGSFACFAGGAIRRCTGLSEIVTLEKAGVPKVDLTGPGGLKEAQQAAAVSKALFGV